MFCWTSAKTFMTPVQSIGFHHQCVPRGMQKYKLCQRIYTRSNASSHRRLRLEQEGPAQSNTVSHNNLLQEMPDTPEGVQLKIVSPTQRLRTTDC